MNPHRAVRIIVGAAVLVLGVAAPPRARAEDPRNLAPTGTAILGLKASLDSGPETEMPFANSGTALHINDGDPATRVDTYNGNGLQTVSFVGIIWDNPVSLPVGHLDLTLALFGNGGWFGVNQIGPNAGAPLADEHLVEPQVQISIDGGASWQNVAFRSDYYLALRGSPIGAPTSVTTHFTLEQPAQNINGIRIIGTEGGTVSGGFLGVFELAVRPPDEDTDGDGLEDGWEAAYGLTVGTNDAAADPDGDGLTNLQEHRRTYPNAADTDGDGLNDGAEVNQYGTSPVRRDTDGDGLSDDNELMVLHTNPLAKDTDGDGYGDALELSLGSDPLNPGNYPSNLAILGTAILGGKPALDSGPETEVQFANSGTPANINDGNLSSKVDTYGPALAVSFVGIVWSDPVAKPVTFLDLTLALFSNGGWFGANGVDPGAGGQLTADHLVEPAIEITTDGGTTWTPVEHTSDYLATMTGQGIGGGANPNPNKVTVSFTLTQPATNINGIRLIGTDGGTAGGGFLGVYELTTRTSVADSDNDGMDDAWERLNGLIVGTDDSAGDPDADTLTNIKEFTAKTNPQVADSDGDGLTDGNEINSSLTNPLRADTDADGLSDGAEVNTHHTNPLAVDSDQDKFSDFVEVSQGSDPNSAASFPNNIASLGRGILGKKADLDAGVDFEFPLFNSGTPANINDGNLNTRVDNYGRGEPFSFVGIVWDDPVTTPIINLKLTLALFSNGGWFGVHNSDPGPGGLLTDTYLVEPRVEITTDGGATWAVINASSDYVTALTGVGIGGGAFPNPNQATAIFTLSQPIRDITGIRVAGMDGGTAGGGFLGVFDLAVNTEPPLVIRLVNVTIANQQFRFEFDSKAGVSHRVEYKTSLSDPTWQLQETIPGDGTRKQVTSPLTGSQAVFRISSE